MPNTAPESKPSIHVAVAVLLNDAGWVLITRRNEKQHQGGLWEFPGGKVEPGESVATALSRELQEELAVTPTSSDPLLQIQHDYGDREVLLDVHCIRAWEGEPRGLEGQPLAWVSPTALADFDFPEANRPIAKACKQTSLWPHRGDPDEPRVLYSKRGRLPYPWGAFQGHYPPAASPGSIRPLD